MFLVNINTHLLIDILRPKIRLKRLARLQSSRGLSPTSERSAQAAEASSISNPLEENVPVTSQSIPSSAASPTGRSSAKQGIETSPASLISAKKARTTPSESSQNVGGVDQRTFSLEAWEDKTLSTIFQVTICVSQNMPPPRRK